MSDKSVLRKDILVFMSNFKNKSENIDRLYDQVLKIASALSFKVDMFIQSERANADRAFVREFFDAKEKVLIKLRNLIDKDVKEITSITERFETFSDELRNYHVKLDETFRKIDWNNCELLPSVMKVIMWTDRCWKYHHMLYANIDLSLKGFALDEHHSELWINKIKNFDRHRDSIYRDPILEMYPAILDDMCGISVPKNLLS